MTALKLAGQGGPGRGQGAKPKPNRKVLLTVRISPEAKAWVDSHENRSRAVDEAIQKMISL